MKVKSTDRAGIEWGRGKEAGTVVTSIIMGHSGRGGLHQNQESNDGFKLPRHQGPRHVRSL